MKPAAVDAGWAGEAFGQGKAAMVVEGNWMPPAMAADFPDRNFAVAELPSGPVGPGTFAFTVCYGVAADAANPEASWALVDALTNEEGSLAWTEAFTVMPARDRRPSSGPRPILTSKRSSPVPTTPIAGALSPVSMTCSVCSTLGSKAWSTGT